MTITQWRLLPAGLDQAASLANENCKDPSNSPVRSSASKAFYKAVVLGGMLITPGSHGDSLPSARFLRGAGGMRPRSS